MAADRPSAGHCTGCGRPVYANARPAAGVFLVRGDAVLLVRRAAPPRVGAWDIPGGFLDETEP
ncbi:MAG: NUDIX domain-containing protein, partial [Deltaproteobacteria bacterium]